MRFLNSIVDYRSLNIIKSFLSNSKFEMYHHHPVSVLYLADPSSIILKELRRRGYKLYFNVSGAMNRAPFDLIIYDGSTMSGESLNNITMSLPQSFQIVLINQRIKRNGRDGSDLLNPADCVKFQVYPIHRWYDILFGLSIREKLRNCPVVRVKPIINTSERLKVRTELIV